VAAMGQAVRRRREQPTGSGQGHDTPAGDE
jgi:hypothetical protein